MKYANRLIEFQAVKKLLDSGENNILIEARHACGISSFVREKIYKSLFKEDTIFLNFVIAPGANLAYLLFDKLIRSPLRKDLQIYADKAYGEKQNSLRSALALCIPQVGSLAEWVVAPKEASPIYTGNYASIFEEAFFPFFTKISSKWEIVLAFDAIQNIDEESYDLLLRLIELKSITKILIVTESNSQYIKLSNFLYFHSSSFYAIDFTEPHSCLIQELASIHGCSITDAEANEILNKSKKNIHEIINMIYKTSSPHSSEKLSSIEEAIVAILSIFTFPVPKVVILRAIARSEIFSVAIYDDFNDAIYNLQSLGIISHNNGRLMLETRYHPRVSEVLQSVPNQLMYKSALLSALTTKNTEPWYTSLKYRLSKEMNCMNPKTARDYLIFLIKSGEQITNDIFYDAHLSKGNQVDCLLAAIKFCRERNFSEAFEWISTVNKLERSKDIKVMYAVLLNRIRRTSEAETALTACIQEATDPAQINLLAAFLISNQIHAENLDAANETLNEYDMKYKECPMHGYLLRNGASAYTDNRWNLYAAALDDFQDDHDYFGYYTTLCNQGYAYCLEGRFDLALLQLKESYQGLSTFPLHHHHIVCNNLGICYIYLEEYEKANQYLTIATKLSKRGMPLLFAQMNRACLFAIMGKAEQSLALIRSLNKEVDKHPLDRIRQKYYINALMIEHLCKTNDLEPLIPFASQYLDRYRPDVARERIHYYQSLSNKKTNTTKAVSWRKLYSPCGLAYWYMDPLKFLSEEIIN